jgi:hypothetical protein
MVLGLMAMAMAVVQPQSSDGVPPVMVQLVEPAAIEGAPIRQPSDDGYRCTKGYADCLLVGRRQDGRAELTFFDMDAAAQDVPSMALSDSLGMGEDAEPIAVWDRAIRLPKSSDPSADARSYLVGLIVERSAFYSGGSASSARLHLHRLTIATGTATLGPELVSLPWTSATSIRACFSAEDDKRRRGVCHDEYAYDATLTLAPADDRSSDLPQLAYGTRATAYPRTARRDEDSTAAKPLTGDDLTRWVDPDCSFTRTLRFNPATQRYEMDRPASACPDYMVP